jgi:pseudouridine-5'-phosphate glycosidase
VPTADALDADVMSASIERALRAAANRGISGPGVTPVVLAEIASDTSGVAVRANLALAENNARLAAALAVDLTTLS